MSGMKALIERVSSDMEAKHQKELARHETVEGWRQQVQWLYERLVEGLAPLVTSEVGGEPLCTIEMRACIPRDLRLDGGEVTWEPVEIVVKLGERRVCLQQQLDPMSGVIKYQQTGSGEWLVTDPVHLWMINQGNVNKLVITDDTLGAFFARAYEKASTP